MKVLSHGSFSILFLLVASMTIATDTDRVGGSGGTSTVTMDCGSNAYIVGITATGGRDGTFGFNLVRKIKFSCRNFTGTTPGSSAGFTPEAAGSKAVAANYSFSNVTCPSDSVVNYVDLYAADYIDRLVAFGCKNGWADHPCRHERRR